MYLDLKDKLDYTLLKKPADIIKNGGVVVFPTETVYGIGVNGLDEIAIRKLYEIKQRPINKPTSLLVKNLDMIEQIAKDISILEYALIKEFFPGPLTIILNKKDIVPNILTANTNTIGVRMPAHEIALNLINYSNTPIATSSCNISGMPSSSNFENAIHSFNGKIDCFIDGGKSQIGLASTVIRVIDNRPHILRQGSISMEQINSVCEKF